MLDQGFPNPPGFALRTLDQTVDAVHLWDFNRALSENSTPDWAVYCHAARAGFDALVSRDHAQVRQSVEMYVLSRLHFTVVTWKKAIEDPIREWGQLLAYLPEVKKRLVGIDRRPNVIFLPAPTLSQDNLWRARDRIGLEALQRGISNHQVRTEAVAEIRDWSEMSSGDAYAFDDVLGL